MHNRSQEASTELMTPSKMNSRRISDVSLDRFGYDPYGRRLSSTEQLQTQQMQMQMQQMQQQVMLSPQEFFALQQQEQLMMQWQQQQQLQRQARSIDSTSSSGAPSPAQQQQPYGWGQPPPRLQRVPWRIHGPAAGPATLEQPPPPPPPRVGTTPVPGMFARFGGRQAVHNGPDTDEYRVRAHAPLERLSCPALTATAPSPSLCRALTASLLPSSHPPLSLLWLCSSSSLRRPSTQTLWQRRQRSRRATTGAQASAATVSR